MRSVSLVRHGMIPIPIRISPIPEPVVPLSGPWRNLRNSHAAACSSGVALALTTVSHSYETGCDPSPFGPTGIGAVAISE